MTPTNEELGSWLLVPLPRGCPLDLAAKITAHNRAAAAWQGRHDRLEVDAAAGRKAVCERVASPETSRAMLAALGAEWTDITKEFHCLFAARMALVDDIRAVAAAIDQEIIKSLGPEIRAAEDALRRSGWPWPYPAGHG